MSAWGICRCRDEADIIASTVGWMLTQVDFVVVIDNCSVDGTRDVLSDLQRDHHGQLLVGDDPEVAHWQSRKMTALAAEAASMGAEWVVPFDADEAWYSPFGRIADILAEHDGAVAAADLYDHRATSEDLVAEADPVVRMGWRTRDVLPLQKVACRTRLPVTITEGNHAAHYPSQQPWHGRLVVRHFPYRSAEQMIRKARNGAAALAATDLPEGVGKHWRDYARLSDEQLTEVFHEHFYSTAPSSDPSLIFDPAPCTTRSMS